MHGWFLSRGAEPCKEGTWGRALLALFMNELGKEVGKDASTSIMCLG